MKREWSFHRSGGGKKRTVLLIVGGILLFVLGFFLARPLCLLFGLI